MSEEWVGPHLQAKFPVVSVVCYLVSVGGPINPTQIVLRFHRERQPGRWAEHLTGDSRSEISAGCSSTWTGPCLS